jgi:HlyD family secretion protein
MTLASPRTIDRPDAAGHRQSHRQSRHASQSHWLGWTLVIGLAIVGGIAAAYAWSAYAGQKSERVNSSDSNSDFSQRQERARLKVKVVHPQKGSLARTTTQPGVLHAFQYADLYAKASGYLTAQSVDIGDTVERGQILAEIFDPELEQRAEQAAAAVEQAKADVQLAEARVVAAEAQVAAAEALVSQRKAQVGRYTAAKKFREKEYVRYIELTQKRAIDYRLSDEKQQDYESALSAEAEAEAAVKTAEADRQHAQAEVVRAKAAVASARANLRVREAEEKFAQIMASYLNIQSPYEGVVTNRNYHRGAFIRSADQGEQPPIVSVARTDWMRVVVYVRDVDVPYLDRGDEAVVQIDAFGGEEFRGHVARYSEYEDPANRTMRAEIDLENPTGRLREGMYGAVTILLEEPTDHLTIPSGALHERTDKGQGTVYLVHGHVANETHIRVGRDDGIRAEVLEGLDAGDSVVVSYSGSLEDGEPVEVESDEG